MSRTAQGIKNSQVALLFYVVEMILGFISRKIFIDYVGADVLGLNTTAMNLLQFLNLAEMGIGSAVSFTLYKPLANKDTRSIQEIIAVQGWLYKRIAIFVAIGGAVMMGCFPWIFHKIKLPLWYAYASFGVLLYTALLTYFFNYKQIALTASQQDYKITLSYKSVILCKNIAQILAMRFFAYGYEWWLGLQFLFATLASLSLNRTIHHNFPYLKEKITGVRQLLKDKYHSIVVKIRQLFFHKIAGYALSQSSPLIIYAYTSLTMVAMYGNYMLIVNGVIMMLNSLFNGVGAGIGNLIAEGDRNHSLKVFKELFSVRFFMVSTIALCLYLLTDPFITLWVGKDFVLSRTVLILILLFAYFQMMRVVVDNFIYGFGMFQDIYAPVIEAVLNVGCSILLGYYFDLPGILGGIVISQVIIIFGWKPYFLFKSGFKLPISIYIRLYLLNVSTFIVICLGAMWLFSVIPFRWNNMLDWLFNSAAVFITIGAVNLLLSSMCNPSMRAFILRFAGKAKFLKK